MPARMTNTNFEVLREKPISLKEACALPCLPRKMRYLRVYRWTHKGVRGVFLEARKVGGLIETSREAVERFLKRVNGETL